MIGLVTRPGRQQRHDYGSDHQHSDPNSGFPQVSGKTAALQNAQNVANSSTLSSEEPQT